MVGFDPQQPLHKSYVRILKQVRDGKLKEVNEIKDALFNARNELDEQVRSYWRRAAVRLEELRTKDLDAANDQWKRSELMAMFLLNKTDDLTGMINAYLEKCPEDKDS